MDSPASLSWFSGGCQRAGLQDFRVLQITNSGIILRNDSIETTSYLPAIWGIVRMNLNPRACRSGKLLLLVHPANMNFHSKIISCKIVLMAKFWFLLWAFVILGL